jgi:phosphohistidine phosphatase
LQDIDGTSAAVKVLYLLRHAKSDWSADGLPDAERPLNKRGVRAAPMVGAAMRKDGIAPALVLCSAARRAMETWALLAPELAEQIPVKTMQSLYLASPSRILAMVRRLPNAEPSVLVLAHNPGLHNLALALAGPGSKPRAMALLQQNYPTGALAEFHFQIDSWADVRQREGMLIQFLRPRDLE